MKIIDWHAGFVAAMKLDLIENEKDLVFDDEKTVANRAQRLDLLIIKNENDAKIINPIGAIFGKYNMTFVGEPYPRKLFNQLRTDGIYITRVIPGIYELKNNLPFRTQVIVTREISNDYGSWLKCLTNHGTEDNLSNIVKNTTPLVGHNKDNADVIMNIFTASNRPLVDQKMKEDPKMCEAVNELFADQIKEKDVIIFKLQKEIAELKATNEDLLSTIADLKAKPVQKSSD